VEKQFGAEGQRNAESEMELLTNMPSPFLRDTINISFVSC